MPTSVEMKKKPEKVFSENQASTLAELFVEAYDELVKASDFNELKTIVKELAEAQKVTERRIGELAGAQARTQQKLEELVQAQARTEERVGRLEAAVGRLAEAQARTEIDSRLSALDSRLTECVC